MDVINATSELFSTHLDTNDWLAHAQRHLKDMDIILRLEAWLPIHRANIEENGQLFLKTCFGMLMPSSV